MAKSGDKELVTIFKEWQGLEDNTISLTEKLFNRTENSFVKAMMSIIRYDSEKRKALLQFALSHMTRETTRVSP
jgi:hypothetical protein